MRHQRIVLGTRGSKLALAQTSIVAQRLRPIVPGYEIEIMKIVTKGDRDQKNLLSVIGGKGIFIRELEEALLEGKIDVAVHSFKDVTTRLAPSLTLASFLRPESVCDVMVTACRVPFDKLPKGARVGTGSMRRKVLIKRLRPDFIIEDIRGNVDTRLAKVERGEYDAVMLSEAGLIRLGLQHLISVRFDPSEFFPAPGQGVITLEIRQSDGWLKELCTQVGDERQYPISRAELSLLETVGFDCRTPLGVYTTIDGDTLHIRGFYVDPADGAYRECSFRGALSDPEAAGRSMGSLLLKKGNNQ